MARGHAPRPRPVKEPLPRWARPLAWVTALLAAGCLVLLLACQLQSRSAHRRFQNYQTALEAVDALVEQAQALKEEVDSQEGSLAALWEMYYSMGVNSVMLLAETAFQQGAYRDCALVLYMLKQSYPDFPEGWGGISFKDIVDYDYAHRYRAMLDVLTAQGYLRELPDGSLALSAEAARGYEDIFPQDRLDLATAQVS